MPTIQNTLRIYDFIRRVIVSNGEAPTMKEIGNHFAIKSSASVSGHLKKMEDRGWIKRSRKWRGIEIVEQERKSAA